MSIPEQKILSDIQEIHDRIHATSWVELVEEFIQRGGSEATDHELAEMLRDKIHDIEGYL